MKVVICQVNSEFYAINIQEVVYIEKVKNVQKLPKSSPFLLGLIELRGSIIPIIDLAFWLGLTSEPTTLNDKRIIIIENGLKQLGLVVNSAKDVIDIDTHSIQSINFCEKEQYKVIKLKDKLVILLALDRLFSLTQDDH